jgi:hypothetical protein
VVHPSRVVVCPTAVHTTAVHGVHAPIVQGIPDGQDASPTNMVYAPSTSALPKLSRKCVGPSSSVRFCTDTSVQLVHLRPEFRFVVAIA